MAKFYRSSVRGRGRDIAPPWWMHDATSVAPTSHLVHPSSDPSLHTEFYTIADNSPTVLLPSLRDPPTPPPRPRHSGNECYGAGATSASLCYHITIESVQTKTLLMGMLDTGTNLPITHPVLADMLGITPQPWPRPIPIKFGNNTDCVSALFISHWPKGTGRLGQGHDSHEAHPAPRLPVPPAAPTISVNGRHAHPPITAAEVDAVMDLHERVSLPRAQ